MAKIDARDWLFEIETVDGETSTWVEIDGINSWELDPNANSSATEDTTFKSKGEYEGHAAQRGGSIELEGFREVDDETGETDPGQAAVDALGAKVGRASLAGFRFRHESQDEWTVWTRAYVELGGVGGGNNDNTSWSATIVRSGAAGEPVAVAAP